MPIPVDVHIRVSVPGGVVFDQAGPADVSALDDISLDIPGGATDQPVAIQPGPATDLIYLIVQVSHGTASISYKPAPAAAAIPLAGAHAYSGPGMAALLGPNPTTLYFSNSGPDPIPVRILAMRGA